LEAVSVAAVRGGAQGTAQRMDEANLKQARILIVDDQPANVLLLQSLLEVSEFANVVSTTDSSQVLSLCAGDEPDLILLDLQMPAPDGFEVMRQLEPWTKASIPIPILVLTADNTRESKTRALSVGASDFLTKPVDTTEVVLRVKNLLTMRFLQLELRSHNVVLEQRVLERTRDLEEARSELVERLALAAEYRDDATRDHARRVGRLSGLMAARLGLPDETVESIRRGAPLHDVGKLAVPDSILLKPEGLTPDEREAMKVHAAVGGEILGRSRSPLLRMSEEIALTHHEWWDGTGYPHGLKGEEIPLSGRIVAAADVFDALTHRQSYKDAWPVERAITEIHRLSGRQFDPRVVETLIAVAGEVAPPAERVRRVA
jgi:response regulator RpfG family c-di-GMP phosphodiesterase